MSIRFGACRGLDSFCSIDMSQFRDSQVSESSGCLSGLFSCCKQSSGKKTNVEAPSNWILKYIPSPGADAFILKTGKFVVLPPGANMTDQECDDTWNYIERVLFAYGGVKSWEDTLSKKCQDMRRDNLFCCFCIPRRLPSSSLTMQQYRELHESLVEVQEEASQKEAKRARQEDHFRGVEALAGSSSSSSVASKEQTNPFELTEFDTNNNVFPDREPDVPQFIRRRPLSSAVSDCSNSSRSLSCKRVGTSIVAFSPREVPETNVPGLVLEECGRS